MLKTLFILSIITMLGGEMTMWYGATHTNMSIAHAGFMLYAPSLLSALAFGTMTTISGIS